MRKLRRFTPALFLAVALAVAGCEPGDEPEVAEDPDEDPTPADEEPEEPDEEEDAADIVEQAARNTEDAETAQVFYELHGDDDATDDTGVNDDDDAGVTDDDDAGVTDEDDNGVTDDDDAGVTDDDDAGVTDDEDTAADPHAAELQLDGEVDFAQDQPWLQSSDEGLVMVIDGDRAYLQVQETGAEQTAEDDNGITDDDENGVTDDTNAEGAWVEVDLDALRDAQAIGGPGRVAFTTPHDAITELQNVVEATEVEATDENGVTDDDENGVTEDDENGVTDDEAGFEDDAGLTQYEVVIEHEDVDVNGVTEDDENGVTEDDENGVTEEDENGVTDETNGTQEITVDVWIDEGQELVRAVRYHLDDDVNGVTDDDATSTGDDPAADAQTQYLTIEFTGFGEEVEIEVPEIDEVMEIDEQQLRQLLQNPGAPEVAVGR